MPAAPDFPIELRPEGPYLPELDLYLDPDRAVPRAFVSHAHADHFGLDASAGVLVATPETLALLAARGRKVAETRPLAWGESLEWSRAGGPGAARLTVEPAGHVLGAAQLVVEHPRGRFVYTGDYRPGAGRTHAAGAPVPCDELLVESTFALPIFRFPPAEQSRAALVAFCRRALEGGDTPVVLAHALGKTQEVVHVLLAEGLDVRLHGAAYKACAAYEALGVPLGVADGRSSPYAGQKDAPPSVVVVPPSAQRVVRKIRRARVALVSGWAILDAALERRRADQGIALSDHADYDDLMATVRATGARFVTTTFGHAQPFATMLVEAGIPAAPLDRAAIDESGEA